MTEPIKNTLYIFGIGPDQDKSTLARILPACRVLFLAKRFAEQLVSLLDDFPALTILPIAPLRPTLLAIKEHLADGNVAVLASGDPFFFGIGKTLIETFPQAEIVVHPSVSSIQLAFARFLLPWDKSAMVSVHGRTTGHLLNRIVSQPLTAILTDGQTTPAMIATALLEFYRGGVAPSYTVHVGENLGLVDERLFSGSLAEAAEKTFSALCCVILVRHGDGDRFAPRFGLGEAEIVHSRGLITKAEVRAAAIHALAIPPQATVWDIGAGSGSVACEIARLFGDAVVYAIEKNQQQLANIAANIKKFAIANLAIYEGEAPAALADLPRPDRIFIGGSGGKLDEILTCCAGRLQAGGRIVVTGVLEQTCRQAPAILHRLGFKVETTKIEVQRISYPEGTVTAFNPIMIITGRLEPHDQTNRPKT